jgi:glutaminyl-tRNA synthetase
VRLKHAYIVKCERVVKNERGEVVELHCTYDPGTRSGGDQADRTVKGTLHWVSAAQASEAEVRLYDHLFAKADPDEVEPGQTFTANLSPNSLEILKGCKLEPGLAKARPGERFQFLRVGYFCVDPDSREGKLVFNRTVTLKDSWAKIEKGQREVASSK